VDVWEEKEGKPRKRKTTRETRSWEDLLMTYRPERRYRNKLRLHSQRGKRFMIFFRPQASAELVMREARSQCLYTYLHESSPELWSLSFHRTVTDRFSQHCH
jgi:hypothetical protein